MTIRAILIGLLVSVGLAAVGYVNDTWLFFSYIGGDLVPTHAFGLLLVGLLLVNPMLRWLGGRFKSPELVVMLSMALMGSVIAGSGMLWTFPHPVVTPLQEHATNPAWQRWDLRQYVPPVMMVNPGKDNKVVTDFLQGLGRQGGPWIALNQVPWGAWRGTLTFWFAVMSLAFIAGMCAVVVVHRQWSQREHLAYPIAMFTNELIEHEDSDRPNPLFRSRPFWIGFALAFLVLGVNGYQKTWNQDFIGIPVQIDCTAFLDKLGELKNVPGVASLLNMQFFFSAVGLAYFLTSEASFSLGIAGWLYALAVAPFFIAGVNMSTSYLEGGLPSHLHFGAYLGLGLMVLYLGRRFYWAVLKRSFFLPTPAGEVLPREANACRLMIISCGALVWMLHWVGLHWLLAVLFVGLCGLLYLMVARIHVSTGLFLIQPAWHPVSVLVGLFGGLALGPHAVIILGILCVVVTVDTRIAMVPLAANVLKVADDRKVKIGRLGGVMTGTIIAAMVVGVLATVYLIYQFGHNSMSSTGTKWARQVSEMPHKMLSGTVDQLEARDQLEEAREGTSTARMLRAVLNPTADTKNFYYAAAIGLALVIACYWLRLLLPRWPLHPLLFLVWGTSFTVTYGVSFLLAWVLKSVITKYGGQQSYRRAKPFFVGLIAGEFAMAVILAIPAVIYYAKFGTLPGKPFLVRGE